MKEYFVSFKKAMSKGDKFLSYCPFTFKVNGFAKTGEELDLKDGSLKSVEIETLNVEFLFSYAGALYISPPKNLMLVVTHLDYNKNTVIIKVIDKIQFIDSRVKVLTKFVNKQYTYFTNRINFSGLGYCCLLPLVEGAEYSDDLLVEDTILISPEYSPVMVDTPENNFTLSVINKEISNYVIRLNEIDLKALKRNYGYPYSISDMSDNYRDLYRHSPKTKFEPRHEVLSKYLPYSFGVEMETKTGNVAVNTLLKNDFVPLKDGSITGDEFTSLPLIGADGLVKLEKFSKALGKVATVDEFCSLHIHLGNTKLTNKEVVSLYKTVFQVQQELFDFVPNYKRSAQYFAKKQDYKDHCKPLKSLGLYNMDSEEEMYDAIYMFVTGNDNEDLLNNQKWNQYPRYHHLNLLNLFGKSKTIEFRLHEPTTNYQKIISWLFIVSGITQYSKKYREDIIDDKIKIKLKDVITDIYPADIASYLNDYIKARTLQFKDSYIDNNIEDYAYLKQDSEVFQEHRFNELFIQAKIEELEMI